MPADTLGWVSASSPADDLTLLGRPARGPVDHVECFPAPDGCTRVRFTTDEVTSLCPVTGQPDISSVAIDYVPDAHCVESKSLKLYLWSFRDRPVFCEALAVEIADEVMRAARPHDVTVVVTQHVRGGIVTEATAERHRAAGDGPNGRGS
jgi:7-cyano-7-deazaguanine reductase